MPALIKAVRKQKVRCVDVLVKAGVDVNAQDAKGMTALLWAAHYENEQLTAPFLNAAQTRISRILNVKLH